MAVSLLSFTRLSTALCIVLTIISTVLSSVSAQTFNASSLLQKYTLHKGRKSACPLSISYSSLADNSCFIPASNISVDGVTCEGKGGKAIEDGAVLIPRGLGLPSLVLAHETYFFAGVESAPRVCGNWAFNTSVISWFILSTASSSIIDLDSGIEIEPGYIYSIYEHFSDLCVYRTSAGAGLTGSSAYENAIETSEDEAKEQVGGMACFPGDATVQLKEGQSIPMYSLKVGNHVQSSTNGEFSETYMFSHYDKNSIWIFLQITTRSGKGVALSPGHYLYLNGIAKRANTARVGDSVSLADGTVDRIVRIRLVRKKGIFNPHTLHGDIVVNGILATTWTAAVSSQTAIAALCPIRFLYIILPQLRSSISFWLPRIFAFARSYISQAA